MPARPSAPIPSDARFTLRTLGAMTLSASVDVEEPRVVLKPGMLLAIVAYTACARHRTASRERLCELFWGSVPLAKAQNSLRNVLTRLGQEVPGLLVKGDGEDTGRTPTRATPVVLSPELLCDRDLLDAAHTRGDLRAVLDLYQGDFLPAFAAPGAMGFEEWAAAERARLLKVFRDAAGALVREALTRANYADAIKVAARVRDMNERDEFAWHLLFDCLISNQDRLRALIELKAFDTIFTEDRDGRDESTLALLKSLRRIGITQVNGTTDIALAEIDIVGREAQFAAILAEWEYARTGHATHLHVEADAGLGKTRLIKEVRARLMNKASDEGKTLTRKQTTSVVSVSANYGARNVSYTLASDLARALCKRSGAIVAQDVASALVALNPALSDTFTATPDTSTGDDALRRRHVAVCELIKAVAKDQPVALLIDDLHWGDAASLRLLEATVPMLNASRVLVVTAARPFPQPSTLVQRAQRIALEALTLDDVSTLMLSVAQMPDESWAQDVASALHATTDGSPLLVVETLQYLSEQNVLSRANGAWMLNAPPEQLLTILGERSALGRRVTSLEGTARLLMLRLAVTGRPVATKLLREAAANPSDFDSALSVLEQRGFAVAHNDAWNVAHDEHGTAIIKATAEEDVRAACLAIGRAMANAAEHDAQLLSHAVQLFVRGGHNTALAELFERRLVRLRREGDERAPQTLAREFLDSDTPSALEDILVKALPVRRRWRLDGAKQLLGAAAALTTIVLSGAYVAWRNNRPLPPPVVATLMLQRWSADGRMRELVNVPIDAARMAAASSIDIDAAARATWRIPDSTMRLYTQGFAQRPDGRGWVATRVVPDSGVLDLYNLNTDGTEQRLTFARSDDAIGSVSPDGTQIAFMTARWAKYGRFDLAVYNTVTMRITQLTGPDDDSDQGAVWSPDGSRIAFVRYYSANDERRLCVIDANGANLWCSPKPVGVAGVLGWADAHHVLLSISNTSSQDLVQFDADRGEMSLVRAGVVNPAMSPDGRYVLCACVNRRAQTVSTFLFEVNAPEVLIALPFTTSDAKEGRAPFLQWSPTSARASYLDTLHVRTGPGNPVVGMPYQLRVDGVDAAGHSIGVRAMRWRSLDTTIATVDSVGVLHAKRAGTLRVETSSGGWRTAQASMTIDPLPPARALFDEQWTHEFASRWTLFGDPKPAVEHNTQFGNAFNTRGDGSFWSGAYTRATFNTSRGVWLEATLSVPVTHPGPSQEQLVGFVTMIDTLAWNAWDHTNSDHPGARLCRFRYPATGNAFGADSIVLGTDNAGEPRVHVPRVLRDGRPFTALVQIFPDGRCGVAIDGQPLIIGAPGFFQRTARVMLVGNTQETHNLVGRVRVHVGIAPLPWSRVP